MSHFRRILQCCTIYAGSHKSVIDWRGDLIIKVKEKQSMKQLYLHRLNELFCCSNTESFCFSSSWTSLLHCVDVDVWSECSTAWISPSLLLPLSVWQMRSITLSRVISHNHTDSLDSAMLCCWCRCRSSTIVTIVVCLFAILLHIGHKWVTLQSCTLADQMQ